MSQERIEEATDDHPTPRVDDAEGRAVLDMQVQILRRSMTSYFGHSDFTPSSAVSW